MDNDDSENQVTFNHAVNHTINENLCGAPLEEVEYIPERPFCIDCNIALLNEFEVG